MVCDNWQGNRRGVEEAGPSLLGRAMDTEAGGKFLHVCPLGPVSESRSCPLDSSQAR